MALCLIEIFRNEEEDVFIWGEYYAVLQTKLNNSSDQRHHVGNLSRKISEYSTVDYQINATANTGDFGALNGTFHICDYLEKMHLPPDSNEPEKACPPSKGPIFIDYAFWFADFLVAPVCV